MHGTGERPSVPWPTAHRRFFKIVVRTAWATPMTQGAPCDAVGDQGQPTSNPPRSQDALRWWISAMQQEQSRDQGRSIRGTKANGCGQNARVEKVDPPPADYPRSWQSGDIVARW